MNNKRPHPAKYSNELLPILAKYAYGSIIDPMGGTGKAGLLKQYNSKITKVTINELEQEWADQAIDNNVDEIIIGDAKNLTGTYDCIVTSPPYGNRMADNFKASKPDSMGRRYAGDLGRTPSEGSCCCKHFDRGYNELITEIFISLFNNVKFDLFILNVSNFIRNFKEVRIDEFFLKLFTDNKFDLIAHERVKTRRQKGVGANTNLRVECEDIFVFKKQS